MAQHDPFTLDLFGNTSLSSGLDLGVTAFPSTLETDGDDGDAPHPPAVARIEPSADRPTSRARGETFYLAGTRGLARSWRDRARDNLSAIRLAAVIEGDQRPATAAEQAQLIRFTGFGASELANGVFRRPGDDDFRHGWEEIGAGLESAVGAGDYASLARCTQYAHFTPEYIVRAVWAGVTRLGFRGGRVLEPGIGTGLFSALMPEKLRAACYLTGVELDPVTARIAALLHPRANIINQDFARTELPQHFDLAIGNPPFSDRTVRSDRVFRSLGLRLHDYFIVKAIDRLKPGGLAAFVTSHGTMDKADASAREHIAGTADLVGAVRLPEGSFRADAGTDVGVDILFFRKRRDGDAPGADAWLDHAEIHPATEHEGAIRVNRHFAEHPNMVLGEHALASGPYGETYTCVPRPTVVLEDALTATILHLPDAIYDGDPETTGFDADETQTVVATAAGVSIREGSYFVGRNMALMQMVDGTTVIIPVKKGRNADGVFAKHARIIRKLIPIRDAVREILKCQETDHPWKQAQVRLRIAWSSFVRDFGPINTTVVSSLEDEETGEVRETHRRPNLAPFADDPDCWLVASIEDYDLETNTARPGPIFTERVIAPPPAPVIASAADALAVVLNERGTVDPDHIAELLHRGVDDVIGELGDAIFRDPATGAWHTADGYLSGAVRSKLATAEAAAALDPAYARNVEALGRVQPGDLRPSDITARLGAPSNPAADLNAFV
jgi:adenine-specific DNA methylase